MYQGLDVCIRQRARGFQSSSGGGSKPDLCSVSKGWWIRGRGMVGASGWIEAGIVRVGLEDLVAVLILPHLPADPRLAANLDTC